MQFSIIIPVYNVAAELTRAVESVKNQDFTDWEIVLVDDGSTDGSGELCDQLAERDARIKAIHQVNQGVVAARQNGFYASSGEWILFLDGDDEQMLGTLSKVASIISTSDPDIIRFGFEMGSAERGFENHFPKFAEGMYSVDTLIGLAKKTPMEATEMCIWDKAYKRLVCQGAFEDVGSVRIKHSEDGLFAFAAFLRARTLYMLHSIGVRYWLRKGSAVHCLNKDIAREKRIFIDKVCSLFRDSPHYRQDLFNRMKAYHPYEAITLIYSKILRWRASAIEVCMLLDELREYGLLRDARMELTNVRRRLMVLLLSRPCAFLIYRKFFRFRRRHICE